MTEEQKQAPIEVQRYSVCDGWIVADEGGRLVTYEAFLALAQRAEAAEAKLSALQDGFAEAIRHKDRLADELNELAKQEPVAWTSQANLVTLKSEQCKTLEFMTGDKSIYSNPVPLYARPAPAVSLAELVPCPYPCGWNNLLSHSMTDAAFLASGLVEDEPVSAGQRESVVLNNDRLIKVITAILRNIKEAK